jgi:NhaA family Na+:H+ antiporter
LDLDLRHWLNDGLMTIFFLVVGLEIKREMVDGHLSNRRAAMLPIAGALGGMLLPALIYLVIAGGDAPRGWAIPMATDIALAVGLLAVAGSRLPTSLRAFLLGLAIVDDVAAIIVIAAVYSTGLCWAWLVAAVAVLLLVVIVRQLGVHQFGVYVVLGAAVWLALHEAGVHPTLAGVALGLLAPSIPRVQAEYVDIDELSDVSNVQAARETTELARGAVSVVEWVQFILHPWSSYLIVPLFALANAGIVISADGLRDALGSAVAWGVFAGLILGKPLGILLAASLSTRLGVAEMPEGTRRVQLLGIGTTAGIGFTVAIFITELALTDPVQQSDAKLAILAASVIATLVSMVLLRFSFSRTNQSRLELR